MSSLNKVTILYINHLNIVSRSKNGNISKFFLQDIREYLACSLILPGWLFLNLKSDLRKLIFHAL